MRAACPITPPRPTLSLPLSPTDAGAFTLIMDFSVPAVSHNNPGTVIPLISKGQNEESSILALLLVVDPNSNGMLVEIHYTLAGRKFAVSPLSSQSLLSFDTRYRVRIPDRRDFASRHWPVLSKFARHAHLQPTLSFSNAVLPYHGGRWQHPSDSKLWFMPSRDRRQRTPRHFQRSRRQRGQMGCGRCFGRRKGRRYALASPRAVYF